MEQFKQYNVSKQGVIDAFEELKTMLSELAAIGVDVETDLKKIESALASVEQDVLRIALMGAFSDGKTSVIAAWLGKVMADMKIDMDESSDSVAIYKPEGLPEKCEIVDTPGLFGDKEKEIDGDTVVYSDLTKQYISEAHIILYVVDATNPLKESHGEIARWLLRDLEKLSSTIFVINKMDEVTDLTEDQLFEEQAQIKADNLKKKLARVASLNDSEVESLNIVCIASNPNGRGLEFWFGKPAHYEARSRINNLKAATQKILASSVSGNLIAKTGMDVVSDIVRQRVSKAHAQLKELEVFAQQRQHESDRIASDISSGRSEVKRLASELFEELQSMERQYLSKLRPLEMEGIRPYLEDELGYSEKGMGYKLHAKIKLTVDHYFDQATIVANRLSESISKELDTSESFLSSMSDGIFKGVGKSISAVSKVSPAAMKSVVFAARDALASVTGVVYKFKPWEATKIAGNITKYAGPAGAAVTVGAELYGAYKKHELEKELQDTKDEISEFVKNSFLDIYEILSDTEKTINFFAPQLKDYELIVTDLRSKLAEVEQSKAVLERLEPKLINLQSTALKAPL
ncbi:GTPase domain-containing protein [Marinobacter nauticus]|uniref:GTP-binding protein n=1 Tax=Marinobacter nauticus TaxID=2743 RepID=A0A1M2UYC5_MARNT|nr:GTPase domain-containing protein [Marinobacter nauticus]OJT00355.1 GTP-binding protein [Marinobacter nauticus]